jgi:inorganic pyrophosphatase
MPNFANLAAFDEKGRVQMVVETPRGATIKYKFDDAHKVFTVSRTLALGVAYPFDWGFIPGTLAEDGDAVDAVCLHDDSTFPGVVLPCRCLAIVDIEQKGGKGRVANPRVILAPDWSGSRKLDIALSDQSHNEIEQFFLNATLFTNKDARIVGWRDADAAKAYISSKIHGA